MSLTRRATRTEGDEHQQPAGEDAPGPAGDPTAAQSGAREPQLAAAQVAAQQARDAVWSERGLEEQAACHTVLVRVDGSPFGLLRRLRWGGGRAEAFWIDPPVSNSQHALLQLQAKRCLRRPPAPAGSA